MADIRFDQRVAVVTGAGGGLGRSHALLLAKRGAKVVINDLGGAVDGSGSNLTAADKVVAEIKAAGGHAIANGDSVDTPEGAQRIIGSAIEAFGRVDIVINNAGILRDRSFPKMTDDDWDRIQKVHLYGTMHVTRAAWSIFRDKSYGRIVNTTSGSGLYGNFGQANYAAAKLGIVGFTRTLAQEGGKYNIKANCIAPAAKSRMTETMSLPAEMLERLSPELVSPLVAYLCSEGVEENGFIYSVGAGYIARVAIVEGRGVRFPGKELTPEQVAGQWKAINDISNATPFNSVMEQMQAMLGSR